MGQHMTAADLWQLNGRLPAELARRRAAGYQGTDAQLIDGILADNGFPEVSRPLLRLRRRAVPAATALSGDTQICFT